MSGVIGAAGISRLRLLGEVDYPIDREELLARARAINAPDAVQRAIGRLRPGPFTTRGDLVAAVEAIITS